jgi:hypothetical protein
VHLRGGGRALVYLLVEHQSSLDVFITFRELVYITRIWDDWLREARAAAKEAGEPSPQKLPPIIPVLVSHAVGGWTAPTRLAAILDGPESLLEVLKPHLPDFGPILMDLQALSDTDLEAMKLRAIVELTMRVLKHGRDRKVPFRDQMLTLVGLMREVLAADGPEALVRIMIYTLNMNGGVEPEDYRGAFSEAIGDPEERVIMSAAEKLRREGEAHGKRDLIAKQLRLKFGELSKDMTRRVGSMTVEELETVGERVLTAERIEDVITGS